jgi:hypothetical protein
VVKIRKNYRLESDVVDMMQTLLSFVSAEKNIKLNETTLLELLVSERYEKLLKDLEGSRK